jgi:hypothetical protein
MVVTVARKKPEADMNRASTAWSLPAAALLAAAAVAAPAAMPAPASAACLLSATYLGAPYVGVGSLTPADVGAPAGRGIVPACNDTPGSGIEAKPSRVTLDRVRGVAPRLAVALRGGPDPFLLVRDPGPCAPGTVPAVLACLRRESARLAAGPALVAPPGARAGAVIPLTVRVSDPGLRARLVSGQNALLQRRGDDGRWRSTHHLLHALPGEALPAAVPVGGGPLAVPALGYLAGRAFPVRLPRAAPGAYRILQRVSGGGASTRPLVAYLTIR